MDPRGGLKTNVKLSVSHTCHFEQSEKSLSSAARDSRCPHVPRTFRLFSSVFHTACALSAPTGHLPLEGKAGKREYPLLKRRRTTLVIPSASRIVIPSAAEGSLLHCRHMHTCALMQTTPWCVLFRLSLTHGLLLCKKDPSTSALMTRKKDDSLTSSFTPLRRVVPLRGTLSCAFGAALLQGPTCIIGVTGG